MPINKKLLLILILFPLVLLSSAAVSIADDELEEIQEKLEKKQEQYESTSKKLSDIRSKKDSISNSITQLAGKLTVTQAELNAVTKDLEEVTNALQVIQDNLNNRKERLAQKTEFRNNLIRTYVKKGRLNDLETFLLSANTFAQKKEDQQLNGFTYVDMSNIFAQAVSTDFVKTAEILNSEIDSFEKDKAEAEEIKNELEDTAKQLANLKSSLTSEKSSAEGELGTLTKKEDEYERDLGNLQKEIADLTAKQQSIINEKAGSGDNGTVGNYEAPGTSTPAAPFKPAFAAFSYGAYTHYNGMSQYGAKGRADAGEDYKEIIKFYYKSDVEKKKDFPDKIKVKHTDGSIKEYDFQYYLYGIAEMPSDWPMEALKAQAIAARTYAYRANKPICTTQSCQVFLESKAKSVPPRWREAVEKTEDMILSANVSSQYSSTTGGYINNVGWDTKGGGWPNNAYEKLAGSPWFRKAWYTKSYNSSDSCGRGHPWLSEKEMADILNSWVVWRKGSNDDKDRISPVTTSCWGGNPYSMDKMAEKADDFGEKYTSVDDVDVEISNGGYTSKVTFKTNRGTVSMDGATFKTVYNLRAPGYVALRSRLFDFEYKN